MSTSATEISYEGVEKLGDLIQLAEDIQVSLLAFLKKSSAVDVVSYLKGTFGGRRQCPFVYPNGIMCDKAFAARYELKRHLRAHLGCVTTLSGYLKSPS